MTKISLLFIVLLSQLIAIDIIEQNQTTSDNQDVVIVVLVGDTGFAPNHSRVNPQGVTKYGKYQTWAQTTQKITSHIDGDINFLNIETVVTDKNNLARDKKGQKSPYSFRTHPNGIKHLVDIGFNIASMANNHSMDYKVAGLKESLKHMDSLKQHGLLAYTGIGLDRKQASAPAVFDIKNHNIGFSSIGIVTNNLSRHRAGKNKPGQVAYRFDKDFHLVNQKLSKTITDYKILSIHYGYEGKVYPDNMQLKQWQDEAVGKYNIDMVVGHHAHVVRPVEIYKNKLIFYGLGNFLHHGTANMTTKDICHDYGLLATVYLHKTAAGRLVAKAVQVLPLTKTHMQTAPFASQAQAIKRIYVLNYLSRQLDNKKTGSQGIRFTPQEDGTGLYCVKDAGTLTNKIGKLCKNWRPSLPIPAKIQTQIQRACRK